MKEVQILQMAIGAMGHQSHTNVSLLRLYLGVLVGRHTGHVELRNQYEVRRHASMQPKPCTISQIPN